VKGVGYPVSLVFVSVPEVLGLALQFGQCLVDAVDDAAPPTAVQVPQVLHWVGAGTQLRKKRRGCRDVQQCEALSLLQLCLFGLDAQAIRLRLETFQA
jgi:hypothetical protein